MVIATLSKQITNIAGGAACISRPSAPCDAVAFVSTVAAESAATRSRSAGARLPSFAA
jgi:hypothetical protein